MVTNKLALSNSGSSAIIVYPTSLPLRQDDPFIDCVWVQVEAESINESLASVILTISLGTSEISPPVIGGHVRVGLNRVKLRLSAEGGIIPHEDRWPEHEVETLVDVDLTEERRRRRGASSKSSIKAEVGASVAKGEMTTEEGADMEEEGTTRRNFRVGDWTARSGGSEERAYWEFRSIRTRGEVHLRLVNREVALFLITQPEAVIRCGIDFMDSDLRIIRSEGLFAGRAGNDEECGWRVALSLLRKALASDLRKSLDPPQV